MNLLAATPVEQGELFQPASFIVEKEALGLRGAGSIAISHPEAERIAQADGTEELLELRVFATVKGYTKEHSSVTWNLVVTDVTLAD